MVEFSLMRREPAESRSRRRWLGRRRQPLPIAGPQWKRLRRVLDSSMVAAAPRRLFRGPRGRFQYGHPQHAATILTRAVTTGQLAALDGAAPSTGFAAKQAPFPRWCSSLRPW